jgi:hypothetical protein
LEKEKSIDYKTIQKIFLEALRENDKVKEKTKAEKEKKKLEEKKELLKAIATRDKSLEDQYINQQLKTIQKMRLNMLQF